LTNHALHDLEFDQIIKKNRESELSLYTNLVPPVVITRNEHQIHLDITNKKENVCQSPVVLKIKVILAGIFKLKGRAPTTNITLFFVRINYAER
jgi:hypothetical protein